MGLLDSVLGAVLGGGQQQAPAQAGGWASIISMVANNPQILSTITGMLSNDGGQGGLGNMRDLAGMLGGLLNQKA